jgi:hypothetical protein
MKLVNRVRKQLRAYNDRTFQSKDLVEVLESPSFKIRGAIKCLLRNGEIEVVSLGIYRATSPKMTLLDMDKAFRAMHVKRIFSAQEIAILADVTLNYTRKIIRRLIASDDLERIGHQKNEILKDESVFRVRHSDQFYLKYIVS